MKSPHARYRSTAALRWFLAALSLAFAVVGYLVQDASFWSALALNIAGAFLSVLLVVAAYDRYHQRRRMRLWRPLRLVADRALAHQLSLLVQTLLLRLTDTYISHGTQIDQCAVDPTPEALGALTDKIDRMVSHLNKFGGSYYTRVRLIPEDEAEQSGESLAIVYQSVLGAGQLRELRTLLTPLAPFAEDSVEVILAAEDLLATAWVTEQSAIAARAGELREMAFMAGFPEVMLKMRVLYAAVTRDFAEATATAAT